MERRRRVEGDTRSHSGRSSQGPPTRRRLMGLGDKTATARRPELAGQPSARSVHPSSKRYLNTHTPGEGPALRPALQTSLRPREADTPCPETCMARPKPRRPKPGRGLPPPYRQTPEEEAEDERLRALLELEYIRLDAILVEKQAEAAERARIRALNGHSPVEPVALRPDEFRVGDVFASRPAAPAATDGPGPARPDAPRPGGLPGGRRLSHRRR